MIAWPHDIYWLSWHRIWYIAPLTLTVALLALYQFYKRRRAVRLLAGHSSTQHLLRGFSWIRELGKLLLIGFAMCSFAISLLRPAWGEQESTETVRGREMYIALDVSKSMRAQDMTPSRLQAAKQKMVELLSRLQCDRVGLILFSGSAFVQCPLTTDYATLRMFLEQVDVESIASGTTALDKAITLATQAFKRAGSDHGSKLLLICTDGEDFSKQALTAAKQAAQSGIHLITLGIASTDGAPIPTGDIRSGSSYQKDAQGTIVISRLDETLLTRLAQETGGSFIRATNNSYDDVKTIKTAIERFEEQDIGVDTAIGYVERYWPFVVTGFGAMIVRMLL